MRLLKIDMIKKHLLAYDYHAALAVGKEIKEDLSPVAYQWLETAECPFASGLDKDEQGFAGK